MWRKEKVCACVSFSTYWFRDAMFEVDIFQRLDFFFFFNDCYLCTRYFQAAVSAVSTDIGATRRRGTTLQGREAVCCILQ